jgi:flagellar biosynthesis protein FlhG
MQVATGAARHASGEEVLGATGGEARMTRGNHYVVLGVEPGASLERIEKAYRYLVDLYGDESLATYSLLESGELRQMRAQLREAYDVLRDPLRRLEYDVRQGVVIGAPESEASTPRPAAEPVVDEALEAPVPPEDMAAPEPRPMRGRVEPAILPEPVTGAGLRAFREARGISLREIVDKTKISLRYLEYIEADRHDDLPAPVYLRGFLQEYAKSVGLDARATAESYLVRCGKGAPRIEPG